METKRLYREAQRMQCMAGDTLPEFHIFTDLDNEQIMGCTMALIIEPLSSPGAAALTKQCARYSEDDRHGFWVQLMTEDTAALIGTYRMHFVMTDANAVQYRKLICDLSVLPVPEV
jgi:hypothetical protein